MEVGLSLNKKEKTKGRAIERNQSLGGGDEINCLNQIGSVNWTENRLRYRFN